MKEVYKRVGYSMKCKEIKRMLVLAIRISSMTFWESSFSIMEGMEIQVMGVWEGMLIRNRSKVKVV